MNTPEGLSKELQVKIQGNDYTIKFPNIGQIVDIETNKTFYSKGQHSNLVRSGLVASRLALDLVEMASTFIVVIPDLEKNLMGVTTLFQLDAVAGMDLVKIYREEFMPWYAKWIDVLRGVDDKEDDKKGDNEDKQQQPDEPTE